MSIKMSSGREVWIISKASFWSLASDMVREGSRECKISRSVFRKRVLSSTISTFSTAAPFRLQLEQSLLWSQKSVDRDSDAATRSSIEVLSFKPILLDSCLPFKIVQDHIVYISAGSADQDPADAQCHDRLSVPTGQILCKWEVPSLLHISAYVIWGKDNNGVDALF